MNRWILAGLLSWPTTLAAVGILVVLVLLHLIGADGIRRLAGEVTALGDLLVALTGAAGALPGLAAVGLAIWRRPGA